MTLPKFGSRCRNSSAKYVSLWKISTAKSFPQRCRGGDCVAEHVLTLLCVPYGTSTGDIRDAPRTTWRLTRGTRPCFKMTESQSGCPRSPWWPLGRQLFNRCFARISGTSGGKWTTIISKNAAVGRLLRLWRAGSEGKSLTTAHCTRTRCGAAMRRWPMPL